MKLLLSLALLVATTAAMSKEYMKLKKWAIHKACESCLGEEATKQFMIKVKSAAATCMKIDAPELDLPMFKYGSCGGFLALMSLKEAVYCFEYLPCFFFFEPHTVTRSCSGTRTAPWAPWWTAPSAPSSTTPTGTTRTRTRTRRAPDTGPDTGTRPGSTTTDTSEEEEGEKKKTTLPCVPQRTSCLNYQILRVISS